MGVRGDGSPEVKPLSLLMLSVLPVPAAAAAASSVATAAAAEDEGAAPVAVSVRVHWRRRLLPPVNEREPQPETVGADTRPAAAEPNTPLSALASADAAGSVPALAAVVAWELYEPALLSQSPGLTWDRELTSAPARPSPQRGPRDALTRAGLSRRRRRCVR